MDKPKVIYKVEVRVSYHKICFEYDDIRDAQYLTDAILLNLDKEASDEVSVAIYPELPEEETEEEEVNE